MMTPAKGVILSGWIVYSSMPPYVDVDHVALAQSICSRRPGEQKSARHVIPMELAKTGEVFSRDLYRSSGVLVPPLASPVCSSSPRYIHL